MLYNILCADHWSQPRTLIPDSEVGARFFAEFTLNAVKGLNDNYLLVILNGASLREESQTKIKESAYKERSTSEFGLIEACVTSI
jgi:hypothetical protein